NVVYHFSPKTSNTSLHYHMEGRHMLTCLDQAEEHGWAIQSKLVKGAFMSGYTFKSIKHVLTQPGVKLDNLPPPPLDPSDCLPMGAVPSWKQGLDTGLPPFSIDGLKNYIISYLIANDLVHTPIHSWFCTSNPQWSILGD
ncbi:hypothetical protein PAXRUDRAFT_173013, partial [Paxillus rubicundulus Ve08.2h10]